MKEYLSLLQEWIIKSYQLQVRFKLRKENRTYLPFSSTASTLAPFPRSSWTTIVSPFRAATCRGLEENIINVHVCRCMHVHTHTLYLSNSGCWRALLLTCENPEIQRWHLVLTAIKMGVGHHRTDMQGAVTVSVCGVALGPISKFHLHQKAFFFSFLLKLNI